MKHGSISELFLELREKANLTQLQLKAAGGPNQSVISRIERGESREPSDETIQQYAKALGLDPEGLRKEVDAILRLDQSAGTPRMGFVHGIGAAPIVAMLMDGKLDMISVSVANDEGPMLNQAGARPGPEVLTKQKASPPFLAESLFEELDKQNFDLIVGPSEKFAAMLSEGGPLIRCAQICRESLFVFMVFGSKENILSEEDLKKYWKIDELLPERTSYPSLRYVSGTLGENYAKLFLQDFGSIPIAKSFDQDRPFPDGFNELLEEEKENGVFRAIVPFSVSTRLQESAKGLGWTVRVDEVAEVYKDNNKESPSQERFPSFSMDLMLRRESKTVMEWLAGGGYQRFIHNLLFYEEQLGSGLRPDLKIVRNVADYLGMKPGECAEQLNKSQFDLLLYPEFLPFYDKISNRRAV